MAAASPLAGGRSCTRCSKKLCTSHPGFGTVGGLLLSKKAHPAGENDQLCSLSHHKIIISVVDFDLFFRNSVVVDDGIVWIHFND